MNRDSLTAVLQANRWPAVAKNQKAAGDCADAGGVSEVSQVREITNALLAQPEFEAGLMMSHHGNGWVSAAHVLSYPLLRAASHIGIDAALDWLVRTIKLKETTLTRVLPIWGLDGANRINLSEGVDLVPLNELRPSAQLSFFLNTGGLLSQPSYKWEPPKMALTMKRKISPLFIGAGETEDFIYFDSASHERLYELRKCLTLAGPVRMANAEEWSQFDDIDFAQYMQHGTSYRPQEIQQWHIAKVGSLDASLAQEVVLGYENLEYRQRSIVSMAIDRFDRALSRSDAGDAAVELSTALEAILGDGSGELVWKVSLRAALVGGGNFEERARIRAIVHAVYELRSKVVHTGQTPTHSKIKGDGKTVPVRDLMIEAFTVVAIILRNYLRYSDVPNWFEAEVRGLSLQ